MKNYIYSALVLLAGLTGCQKEPDYDELSTELIVATSQDKAADFASYKTFFVSDTVINLGGTGADSVVVGPSAKQVVDAVKNSFISRGYSFVPRAAKPDLGIKIGIVKVVNVDVYTGWWTGYAGWYPYYWGGWYPYYYPFTTVYTYDTGSIIVDTYDLKNAAQNKQYRVIWNMVGFGAVGSDINTNVIKGVNAINQGFQQSQYIHAK